MSGLRTLSSENLPKSRSALHSSETPWSMHKAAIRASWIIGPATRLEVTTRVRTRVTRALAIARSACASLFR